MEHYYSTRAEGGGGGGSARSGGSNATSTGWTIYSHAMQETNDMGRTARERMCLTNHFMLNNMQQHSKGFQRSVLNVLCFHLREPFLRLESGGGGGERGLGGLYPLLQVLEKVLTGLPERGLFRLQLLVPVDFSRDDKWRRVGAQESAAGSGC